MNNVVEIQTNKGIYEFNEIKFELGVKKINREIAKENLLDLRKCLERHNIIFGLMYGTLLGAIREGNFIAHDEDIDLFMFKEDREKFLETLFELREMGIEVGRDWGYMISIIRNGEYIDIYFYGEINSTTYGCDGYVIKKEFLDNLIDYDFLGTTFKVPKEYTQLLVELYGADWETPKENCSMQNYGTYLKIRNYVRENFKIIFPLISWTKRKLHV